MGHLTSTIIYICIYWHKECVSESFSLYAKSVKFASQAFSFYIVVAGCRRCRCVYARHPCVSIWLLLLALLALGFSVDCILVENFYDICTMLSVCFPSLLHSILFCVYYYHCLCFYCFYCCCYIFFAISSHFSYPFFNFYSRWFFFLLLFSLFLRSRVNVLVSRSHLLLFSSLDFVVCVCVCVW